MGAPVLLPHMVVRQMCVYLCRRNTRVSKKFLHVTQTCAAPQKMRRKAVAQSMRRQGRGDPGPAGIGAQP